MINSIKMYFRYISVSFQGQLQYKISFLLQTLAQFAVNFAEFIGIYSLFSRFGNIKGLILPEIAVFYGMISVAFAVNDALTRGFNVIGQLIKMGELGRILLRPRSTILQLFGFEFTLKRIGRFAGRRSDAGSGKDRWRCPSFCHPCEGAGTPHARSTRQI